MVRGKVSLWISVWDTILTPSTIPHHLIEGSVSLVIMRSQGG